MTDSKLINRVCDIAREAGSAILDVYDSSDDIAVYSKDDDSPLTEADLSAHKIIVNGLQTLTPDTPILSEESSDISWSQRQQWHTYWLVDPLDGTKEFISRNGEFTVNVAMIENGVPVLGVVYAPVKDILYFAEKGSGAYRTRDGETEQIYTGKINKDQHALSVVASRSHKGAELEDWLERVSVKFSQMDLVSMGSSLKICLVAEGRADIYPRLALTSEWDTAAAQAILEAAGGVLMDAEFREYRYNQKENILNPYFFAIGDPDYQWQSI